MTHTTRRNLLGGAAATLAAARALLPQGAYAQAAGPETTAAQLGYVGLTDAAALVVAKDRGLFAQYGMPDVELSRQGTWDVTCENLSLGGAVGGLDGAHLLTPLAYFISLGTGTKLAAPVPLHILARLNTNGQSIAVAKGLRSGGVGLDASPLAAALRKAGDKRVGMTFRGGTHDLWLRYWLAAAGIDPDRDVEALAAAPRDIVSDMRIGAMKACCMGEPWPGVLVRQDVATIACSTGEIWRDHPEKSLAVRAEWVAAHPRAAASLVAAVAAAQQWSDQPANKPELAALLSKRIGAPAADILPRLQGVVDYGDGRRVENSPVQAKYWADGASYPFPSHDLWFLVENIRWGILPPDLDMRALVAAVNREDVWRAGAKLAGVAAGDMPAGTSRGKETFFDGMVFDPADPGAYLAKVRVKRVAG